MIDQARAAWLEGVMDQTRGAPVEPRLGLWDAVSILVGIIIGVGIFETPADIFSKLPGPWAALGVWLLGGILALVGALCFAELASAYPRSGGEYVYLTRAFGRTMGYLFAWAQLVIIRPGSIGGVAYIFALYANRLFHFGEAVTLLLALLSILLLTGINILGVTLGKHTQNLLTLLKVIGLGSVILVGLLWGSPVAPLEESPWSVEPGWFAVAMILVLWTYSGWHEAAYVVAEVKDPRRNVPRALILGTLVVTVVYLAFNAGVLLVLGWEGAKAKGSPLLVLAQALGAHGAVIMSVLIMVSALGAINGMIFTTARIYSEFGADHRLFHALSRWSGRWGTPVRSLVTQGAISSVFLVGVTFLVNLLAGEDKLLTVRAGFDKMIEVTAAVFWLFFLLTGVSLMVLRKKDPDTYRPFRVPLYPVLPILFCAWCGYMVYGAVTFRMLESAIGFGLLVLGLAFYFLPQKLSPKPAPVPREPEPAGVG